MKTIYRCLLHLPVGLFAGWLTNQFAVAGIIFAVGFLVYQVAEDWRINDRSYHDIFGFLIGFAVSSTWMVL